MSPLLRSLSRRRVALGVVLFAVALTGSLTQSRARLYDTPSHSLHGNHRAQGKTFAQVSGTLKGLPLNREHTTVAATINGAVSPDLIPDDIAYGHFLRATAPSSSADDVKRREAFLRMAGLSETEREVFVQALGNLGAQLAAARDSRSRRLSQLGDPSGRVEVDPVLESVKQTEVAAVADAQARVRAMLPSSAVVKLDAYIRGHVKSRIKIYRAPMK